MGGVGFVCGVNWCGDESECGWRKDDRTSWWTADWIWPVTVAIAVEWGIRGNWTTKLVGEGDGGVAVDGSGAGSEVGGVVGVVVGVSEGEGRGVAITNVLGTQLNGT